MNTKINDQRRNVNIRSEKLYTQNEVDDLHKNWDDDHLEEKEIEKETQAEGKRKRQNKKKVARLVKKSNRILLSICSHALPFDFFPTIINIEEKRIAIIDRHFLSSEVHSIDIKNISNVLINNTLIFSEIIIISKTFEENEIKVINLRTKEAVYARRIIEGLRIFESENIDTYDYTKEELIAKLQELSTTKIVK